MLSLEEIKARIERTLIATDGNPQPQDMALIIREAREAGISDQQIARLVPEVDRAINWEAVREEKAARKAAEEAAAEQEEQAREEEENAEAHLAALIRFAMDDGIATTAELRAIFDKSKALKQSDIRTASRIKAMFDERSFRPFPAPDLSGNSLKDVLLSTNWHNEERYEKISKEPPPAPSSPSPAATPASSTGQTARPAALSPASPRPQPPRPVTLPYAPNSPLRQQPAPRPFVEKKKSPASALWILLVLLIPVFFLLKREGVFNNLFGSESDVKARTITRSAALRSSMSTNSQSNIIGDLQFGTQFQVLDTLGSWLRVKTLEEEGYVATGLTVSEEDYQRLASMFYDEESRNAVPAVRCRLALLDYFKEHNFSGPLITEDGSAAAGSGQPGEQWQVKASDAKPSTVFYGKVSQPGAAYSDFGVVITQRATGRRRFLLFSFDREGKGRLIDEQDAPERGNILSITKKAQDGKDDYVVKYG